MLRTRNADGFTRRPRRRALGPPQAGRLIYMMRNSAEGSQRTTASLCEYAILALRNDCCVRLLSC